MSAWAFMGGQMINSLASLLRNITTSFSVLNWLLWILLDEVKKVLLAVYYNTVSELRALIPRNKSLRREKHSVALSWSCSNKASVEVLKLVVGQWISYECCSAVSSHLKDVIWVWLTSLFTGNVVTVKMYSRLYSLCDSLASVLLFFSPHNFYHLMGCRVYFSLSLSIYVCMGIFLSTRNKEGTQDLLVPGAQVTDFVHL